MPIYEYRCGKCEHFFEVLVRGPSDAPAVCPSCGASQVRRQLSTFAAHVGHDAPGCSLGAAGGCDPRACGSGRCPMANPR